MASPKVEAEDGSKEAEAALAFARDPEPVKSRDDDPSKTWDFFQFKKIMSEIPPGSTTVGSMLGAMVYQISQDNSKRVADAKDPKHYQSVEMSKKMS